MLYKKYITYEQITHYIRSYQTVDKRRIREVIHTIYTKIGGEMKDIQLAKQLCNIVKKDTQEISKMERAKNCIKQ